MMENRSFSPVGAAMLACVATVSVSSVVSPPINFYESSSITELRKGSEDRVSNIRALKNFAQFSIDEEEYLEKRPELVRGLIRDSKKIIDNFSFLNLYLQFDDDDDDELLYVVLRMENQESEQEIISAIYNHLSKKVLVAENDEIYRDVAFMVS